MAERVDTKSIRYEVIRSAPAEEIIALYRAGGWWNESDAWRRSLAATIEGSFCFLVARLDDGRIVGMGRAISDGVSDAYVQDVVVLNEYRGQGIGAEIVRRIVEFCRDKGLEWVGLVAEPGTKDFYGRLGFRERAGYSFLLMEEGRD